MAKKTQAERTEASRRQLIEAATVLFGEKGYSRTTLREVGERAGVSSGLATYHFGTKEALFREVMVSIRSDVRRDSTADVEALRGLAWLDHWSGVYLLGYVKKRASRSARRAGAGGQTVFVGIAEAISATPELRDVVVANDEVFRGLLRDALEEAIADGDADARIDVGHAAIIIMGMLRGIALQYLVAPNAVDLEAVLPSVHASVRAVAGAPGPSALGS